MKVYKKRIEGRGNIGYDFLNPSHTHPKRRRSRRGGEAAGRKASVVAVNASGLLLSGGCGLLCL